MGLGPSREQKVEVTIYTIRSGVVRVEDAEESLYAAIDVVCDKVSSRGILWKDTQIVHAGK